MEGLRRRARRATVREVLFTALELERKAMALYARFVQRFARRPELRNFWFDMAQHEASHCGVLGLVGELLAGSPQLPAPARLWFDPATVVRLRALLAAYLREARGRVGLARALEMAVDIESSELEELVLDLVQAVAHPLWRERAAELLAHDTTKLKQMVERYGNDRDLLGRAHALSQRWASVRGGRRGGRRRCSG